MAKEVKPKVTKEQLVIDLAAANKRIADLETDKAFIEETNISQAKLIRKEFAKAFGWESRGGRDIFLGRWQNNEPETPTWNEIFVEIGRLKGLKDYTKLQENVNCLENDIRELIQKEQEREATRQRGGQCGDRVVE